MHYLKNALLVAMFALLGFGSEAAPLHIFSTQSITATAPEGDGVVHVIQGRHGLRVEVIVADAVALTVVDSEGNVVYENNLTPQARRTNINTNNYPNGVYTLIAETPTEVQRFGFTIGE